MKLLLPLLFAVLTCAPVAFAEDHPIAAEVASKLKNPKKKFTLIIKAKARPGTEAQVIEAFAAAIEPTRKEDGCIRYDLNQADEAPDTFVVYERWGSLEKLKAHLAQPHTVKLLETITPLLDGKPEIHVLIPKADPVKPKAAPPPSPAKPKEDPK